ncbi:MAG: ParB/RepB/Spo0J family partition protein, partial [Candidatus Weimeria sp.]
MAGKFDKALGSATLKKAGKVSKEKANAPKVEMIDISLLDENPDNKLIFNMDEIDRLAKSIETEGFRGAVDVFKKPDGRYEISAGHRRVRAARQVGLTEIPCFINAMPDDTVRARKLLDSNITNRVLKPLDYARAIEYYIECVLKPSGFKGQVNKECAAYFNISASNVYRYRALLTMEPSLQVLADDDRFPYSAFAAAHRLSKKGQDDLAKFLSDYSENNKDENGESAEVGKSFIEKEIRKRLKEEDNYRESRNADIAAKHKDKETPETKSG